jgi:cytochrome oxidase Cu insertion factor (SCO1/SenC/PrrC family)
MKMKKNRTVWAPGLVAALVFVGSAVAQSDPRQQATSRFEATAPAVGEPAPDLVVYNSGGEKLRLGSLVQGHYTVIVLGCLT